MKSPHSSHPLARCGAIRKRFVIPALALGSALFSGQSASAAVYTWLNTGTDFNAPGNWTSGTVPGAGDTASFNGPAATNADVSAATSILGLSFATTDAAGYTISSASSSALTLLSTLSAANTASAIFAANTSGSNTISAPLIFGGAAASTQTIQVALGGTLNITGNLSNTNAITLQIGNSGLGTVNLNGTSTGLTASVKLNGGTLVLGNNSALGSGSFTFGTTSTFQSSDSSIRTVSNALGAFGGSNPIYTFGTSTTGDLSFSSTTSASISGANARVFTVNNVNTTIAAPLTASGGGGLRKAGTGNLILLGANTYAGAATVYGVGTTISAGTLTVGNGTGGASLPATSSLNNAGALVFNTGSADASTTVGSAASSGTITKSGAGSVTINSPTFNAATNSTTTINVSATAGLLVGSTVTGPGIPAGTTITAIGTPVGSVTPVTLSNSATATASAVPLVFGSSYTGAITVNGGTLSLGGAGTVLSGASAITISNGTTLGYSNPDQAFLNRINNSGTASSGVTAVVALGTGFAGAATLDFTNLPNVTLGATSNVTLSSGTITPANNLYRLGGGTGVLTVTGALISGAASNLEVNGSIIIGSSVLAYGGATTINSGGRLRPAANNRIPSTTAMTVNSGGALDLGNTDTGTTTTVASLAGAGLVTNSSSTTTAPNKVLAVNPAVGVSTTFSGVIEDRTNAAVAGATLSLTKTGAGSLNLTGANTYSGPTAVSGGRLFANNTSGSATGTSAVSVSGTSASAFGTLGGGAGAANGGTLGALAGGATSQSYTAGILGLVSGGVTVNQFGHLAPGNSVGTLTVGSLTLASGSVLDYEFNGTANDLTSVTGALTLNSGAGTVSINLLQEGGTTAYAATGTYNLFGYGTGSAIDTTTLTVANPQSGFNYAFNNDAADGLVQLNISAAAVPEPSTWLGGAVLLAGLGWRVLRSRRTVA